MKHERFVTLDGLRGVAAISVFIYHLGGTQALKAHHLFPSAYLAVDFFFLLSGFVISKAYEESLLTNRTFFEFVKIRLIRLYPLIFLGMMVGFLSLLDKVFRHHALPYGEPPRELYEQLVLGLILVPSFLAKTNPEIYPLDNPTWSLFYELICNFAWALWLPLLTKHRLAIMVIFFGLIMLFIGHQHHGVDTGFKTSDYKSGLIRAAFSFSFGIFLEKVLIPRGGGILSWIPSVSGFWPALALALTFFCVKFSDKWVYDLICIFFVYPVILIVGARAHLPRTATIAALFLGELSYPIYVLHVPLVVYNSYHLVNDRHGLNLALALLVVTAILLIVCWFFNKFYDKPVRRFLTKRLERRAQAQTQNV